MFSRIAQRFGRIAPASVGLFRSAAKSVPLVPARGFASVVPTRIPLAARAAPVRIAKRAATTDVPESFVNGTNATALEAKYEQYLADENSVDENWRKFFRALDGGAKPGEAIGMIQPTVPESIAQKVLSQQASGGSVGGGKDAIYDSVRLSTLMRLIRVRGHLESRLDPLGLQTPTKQKDLDPATYGFVSEADMNREIIVGPQLARDVNDITKYTVTTPAKAIAELRAIYCNTVGVEYYHIHDSEQRDWLQEQLERPAKPFTKQEQMAIYTHLAHAEMFETFLANKFGVTKRFGLEGGEALLPMVEGIIETAAEQGVQEMVIGMPHRGRLNILSNTMKKPYRAVLHGFLEKKVTNEPAKEEEDESEIQGSGDVKYHLGTTVDRDIGGKPMHLTLCPNPSHLEVVNPVVEGRTRAKQFYRGDSERKQVMSLLMHGDAAFAGQGVVAETLGFTDLNFFRTGGTLHVIVNNQIGFTTDPVSSRSTPYPSDLAKGFGAPILHVNADDPEAVVRMGQIAVAWRQKFAKSIVLDLVCYRRHGHNEGDEPSFTQPYMYAKIKQQVSARQQYRKMLLDRGIATEAEVTAIDQEFLALLNSEYQASKDYHMNAADWIPKEWKDLSASHVPKETGVSEERLLQIGKHIATVPEGFTPHERIMSTVFGTRKRILETKKHIDWAFAELLAYGSLLLEGHNIRLSGQDVERGTFSHRHAILHDFVRNNPPVKWNVLDDIAPNQQGRMRVGNSSLSEFGVLGFEYGVSLESPRHLSIWEAQFGDFANGGQVIFDQFISAGEAKWYTQSGLVCLLPHGYEGQGPEHSSARVERYLQQSSEDSDLSEKHWSEDYQQKHINWSVVMINSPANLFHVLRRQLHRNYRKPLIVATTKRHLRLGVSELTEFLPGTAFRPVLEEKATDLVPNSKIRRVVFVSGGLYFQLLEERTKRGVKDVAIVAVEELAPFPFAAVRAEAAKYPNAEVVWAQEEPKNMGSYEYVRARFENALNTSVPPRYIGRKASASPATGYKHDHTREWNAIVSGVFGETPRSVH